MIELLPLTAKPCNVFTKQNFPVEKKWSYRTPFIVLSIQQQEDSFHHQIGPKFKEETSKVLHLENSFV
jgi:hypothetical protein